MSRAPSSTPPAPIGFPVSLAERSLKLRPTLDAYGMAEHVLLSYGDEKARVDPWSLVTEDHAMASAAVAEESVALARDAVALLFAD